MRRIKKAKIHTISLVPKGANRLPVIYKSDGHLDIATIVKNDIDNGEITAVVYAPELRDSQGDIASAEVIKDMAYDFAKDGLGSIDLRHNGKPVSKEDAFVAESFIVQKGDPRFAGMTDYNGEDIEDLSGAWATVIKVESEELRKLYREGKWVGVSMAGDAEVTTEKADGDSQVQKLLRKLVNHLGMSRASAYQSINLSGEIDMTGDELKKALAENNKALVESFSTGLVKSLTDAGVIKKEDPAPKETPAPAKGPAKPIFKGDISDEKAVRKFEYDCKRFDIEKDIDKSDPASISAGATAIRELNKEYEDVLTPVKKTEKPAPSNTTIDGDDSNAGVPVGLSKEDADLAAAGRKIAASINKSRGL